MSSSFFAIKIAFAGTIGTTVVGGSVYGAYVMMDIKDDNAKDVKVDSPKTQEGSVSEIDESETLKKQDETKKPSISGSQNQEPTGAVSVESKSPLQADAIVPVQVPENTTTLPTDVSGNESPDKSEKTQIDNNLFTVFVVGEATTLTGVNNTSTNLSTTNRNYICKLSIPESTEDDSCVVKLITSPINNKKHINLTSLTELTSSDETTIAQLNENTNYFKIDLKKDTYSKITWSEPFPTIDIYSKDTPENKYGSLKILLGVNDKNIDGKTVYSVGKIKDFKKDEDVQSNVNSVNVTSGSASCLFFTENNPPLSCLINKFSETSESSSFSELTFVGKDEEETGEIKKDSYYLFKLTDSSKSKSKSEFKTDASVEVAVTATNLQPSGVEAVNKLNIEDLVPAVLIGSDENKSLLLLGDIPEVVNN